MSKEPLPVKQEVRVTEETSEIPSDTQKKFNIAEVQNLILQGDEEPRMGDQLTEE